jgi:Phage endonuclease I.
MSRRSKNSTFRSTFEEDVSKILKEFDYEPFTVPYTIERSYRPDFVHNASGVLVECKGYFRDGDTKKYTSVRDSLPEGQTLVFVLMQPNKKIRKGAKMTMSQWCDKENILWYTIETLQELINYVTNTRGN